MFTWIETVLSDIADRFIGFFIGDMNWHYPDDDEYDL